MALVHLKHSDYLVSSWSGGTTTQLAIAPAGALYAERTFLWRISSATVELEESDFTPLPDYDRFISTLSGTMVLSHGGGEKITLAPYDVHFFDGGVPTHSWGRCTDFNLMLRKGRATGSVRSARLGEPLCFSADPAASHRRCDRLIFCGEGSVRVKLEQGELILAPGEAALLTDETAPAILSGTGAVLLAEMYY